MVKFIKTVISKTTSIAKNILNGISSNLKITLYRKLILENNEIEFLSLSKRYCGFNLYDEQLKWFTLCEKGSINLICAARQSGKTTFLNQYYHYLKLKGKSVLVVCFSSNIRDNYYTKNNIIDICTQYDVNKKFIGEKYDVVLIDEMSYFTPKFEHHFKTGLFNSVEKLVVISTSYKGSMFNKLIINNIKRNPNPNLEYANTFNCYVVNTHNAYSSEITNFYKTIMGDRYEFDYLCRLD